MFKLIHQNSLLSVIHSHIISYSTPINLSYIWSIGAMLGLVLTLQIYSGFQIAEHYISGEYEAFTSVQDLTNDINYGWYLRYLHANGASLFFILVYLHIAKALFYGSYQKRHSLTWVFGVVLFIIMMATAFIGYVLPWGQMSFWGATVITNLFSVVPFFGDDLVSWLWGDFGISEPLLNRFLAMHYILPFSLAGIIFGHLIFLHIPGSNNPLGFDVQSFINFFPNFAIKDLMIFIFTLLFLSFVLALFPLEFGHPDNDSPAQAMVTPRSIVPEWYFLPFYAILRSFPNKKMGVFAMFLSLIIFFLMPFLTPDMNIKSSSFRPIFAVFLGLFYVDLLVLGWIGQLHPESPFVCLGFYFSIYYYSFFFLIIPSIAMLDFALSVYQKEEYLKTL